MSPRSGSAISRKEIVEQESLSHCREKPKINRKSIEILKSSRRYSLENNKDIHRSLHEDAHIRREKAKAKMDEVFFYL